MSKMSRRGLAAFAAAFVIAIAGLSSAQAQQKPVIKVSSLTLPVFNPLVWNIMKARGIDAKHGFELDAMSGTSLGGVLPFRFTKIVVMPALIASSPVRPELLDGVGVLPGPSLTRFEQVLSKLAATPHPATTEEMQTTSAESVALSKALKKRGFAFVGPTTMFALMEAIGVFDPHLVGCFRRGQAS